MATRSNLNGVGTRPSTLQQYFGTRPWESKPFTRTGSEEFSNRLAWGAMPMTNDMLAGNEKYKRSQAAHDAYMKAEGLQAVGDNELLATATEDELANLFGQPRTEREARLQQIVQGDVNARERGVRMIGTPKERTAYAQSLANLKRTNLQNYLDPLQFQLEQDRFGETMNQNDRGYLNQLAQRQHATKQLSAQERFREIQRQNAEANRMQRGQIQNQNFGQRQQFHGDSQANQGLSQMMQMERMLQDAADAEQRQRNVEATQGRDYYRDVAAGAAAGAIPPDEISKLFASRFDPATLALIQGYGKLGQSQANLFAPEPEAPGFLSRLFGGAPAAPVASPNAQIDWGTDDYSDEGDSFDMGTGSDFAPPPAMAARPMVPAPQRRQFAPGSTVRDPRTGRQFIVLPNGQFRPL